MEQIEFTLAGYVGLPAEKTNAAAGLLNFMRNIGQSVGTSAVTTLIARRSQYHQSVLAGYTASARFHDATTALAMRLSILAAGNGIGSYVCRLISAEEK
jgi:DHA2 family multidrug resistance protein